MQRGSALGQLGSIATIAIPAKFVLAGPEDTRKIMEAMHNPTNGNEIGLVAPDGGEWFIVFEYSDTDHVQDDEKVTLDADAILASLRKGQKEGNKDRQKRGWHPSRSRDECSPLTTTPKRTISSGPRGCARARVTRTSTTTRGFWDGAAS